MPRPLRRLLKALVESLPIAAACRLVGQRRLGSALVVLCFDAEPEERQLERGDPEPWTGFERLLELIPAAREELTRLAGAPASFTWCLRMDPQVEAVSGSPGWLAEAYGAELEGVEAAGDELGLHTHVWARDGDRWVVDYEPGWGRHSVDLAFDAFESAFGRTARAHRFGDRALTAGMLAALEARGVTVDLTVEPGLAPDDVLPTGDGWRGERPDLRRAPLRPYRSSARAFPAPDRGGPSGPLLVPMATYPSPSGPQPLWLSLHPAVFAIRLLTRLVRERPPVLAFVARTDGYLVDAWGPVTANLRHLARHRGVRFVTASAAAEALG